MRRGGNISHASFKDMNPFHEVSSSLSESYPSKQYSFESGDPKHGSGEDTCIA